MTTIGAPSVRPIPRFAFHPAPNEHVRKSTRDAGAGARGEGGRMFARSGRIVIGVGVVPLLLVVAGAAGGVPRGLEGVPSFVHVCVIIGESTALRQIDK